MTVSVRLPTLVCLLMFPNTLVPSTEHLVSVLEEHRVDGSIPERPELPASESVCRDSGNEEGRDVSELVVTRRVRRFGRAVARSDAKEASELDEISLCRKGDPSVKN